MNIPDILPASKLAEGASKTLPRSSSNAPRITTVGSAAAAFSRALMSGPSPRKLKRTIAADASRWLPTYMFTPSEAAVAEASKPDGYPNNDENEDHGLKKTKKKRSRKVGLLLIALPNYEGMLGQNVSDLPSFPPF